MGWVTEEDKWHYKCSACRKVKSWYRFPIKNNSVCFDCIERRMIFKVKKLMNEAESRNMNALREKLFDTMDGLKDKSVTVQEAKAICEVAQVIINTAKVEIDFIKAIGSKKGGNFIQIESGE